MLIVTVTYLTSIHHTLEIASQRKMNLSKHLCLISLNHIISNSDRCRLHCPDGWFNSYSYSITLSEYVSSF